MCHASGPSPLALPHSSPSPHLSTVKACAHHCGFLSPWRPAPPTLTSSFSLSSSHDFFHACRVSCHCPSVGPASQSELWVCSPANQPITCTLKSPHFCSFVAAPSLPLTTCKRGAPAGGDLLSFYCGCIRLFGFVLPGLEPSSW